MKTLVASFSEQRLIFLYGPPGSGKTTVGKQLAKNLDMSFCDLDAEIESLTGQKISQIFQDQSESTFRNIETTVLRNLAHGTSKVIALGGGTLCNPQNKVLAQTFGQVICLNAKSEILVDRLQRSSIKRPLLGSEGEIRNNLISLLELRRDHYSSFQHILDVSNLTIFEAAWQVQVLLGLFIIKGLDEDCHVSIKPDSLKNFGGQLRSLGWTDRLALVSDSHVAPIYSCLIATYLKKFGFHVIQETIPSGEKNKTIHNCCDIWNTWVDKGIDRSSGVIALGGGVVCDQVGFAASTFMRGIHWAAIPTSLLAMVDACVGGKTGVNLPQGKNLIGSFYSPSIVLADPNVLVSLPVEELRNGMGEVVKHSLIADPQLFFLSNSKLSELQLSNFDSPLWLEIIKRAIAVKIQYVQADPYEKGQRAALNLGHTIGHALEIASNFQLRHGEAVAIGLVYEARLSAQMRIADDDLSPRIETALTSLGLPTTIPDYIDRKRLIETIRFDKKMANGKIYFSLPVRIGKVLTGIVVEREMLKFLEEA